MSSESHELGLQHFGNPLLLTINQVAAMLNLGRTKTYEIVRSGKIKSVKVGSRRLIPRQDVERFVEDISDDKNDDWN